MRKNRPASFPFRFSRFETPLHPSSLTNRRSIEQRNPARGVFASRAPPAIRGGPWRGGHGRRVGDLVARRGAPFGRAVGRSGPIQTWTVFGFGGAGGRIRVVWVGRWKKWSLNSRFLGGLIFFVVFPDSFSCQMPRQIPVTALHGTSLSVLVES